MTLELWRLADRSASSVQSIFHGVDWGTMLMDTGRPWQTEATVLLMLVQLKDALATMDRLGYRVTFADDVQIVGDVTDLVREMRNAACHNGSVLRIADPNRNSVHFGMVAGKGPLMTMADGYVLEGPYEDDIAFFYGRLRILLSRHIWQAAVQARALIELHDPQHGYHPWPT